jgi:hypothetical protein
LALAGALRAAGLVAPVLGLGQRQPLNGGVGGHGCGLGHQLGGHGAHHFLVGAHRHRDVLAVGGLPVGERVGGRRHEQLGGRAHPQGRAIGERDAAHAAVVAHLGHLAVGGGPVGRAALDGLGHPGAGLHVLGGQPLALVLGRRCGRCVHLRHLVGVGVGLGGRLAALGHALALALAYGLRHRVFSLGSAGAHVAPPHPQ